MEFEHVPQVAYSWSVRDGSESGVAFLIMLLFVVACLWSEQGRRRG